MKAYGPWQRAPSRHGVTSVGACWLLDDRDDVHCIVESNCGDFEI